MQSPRVLIRQGTVGCKNIVIIAVIAVHCTGSSCKDQKRTDTHGDWSCLLQVDRFMPGFMNVVVENRSNLQGFWSFYYAAYSISGSEVVAYCFILVLVGCCIAVAKILSRSRRNNLRNHNLVTTVHQLRVVPSFLFTFDRLSVDWLFIQVILGGHDRRSFMVPACLCTESCPPSTHLPLLLFLSFSHSFGLPTLLLFPSK